MLLSSSEATNRTLKLFEKLNCTTGSREEALQCARNLDPLLILNKTNELFVQEYDKTQIFLLVQDNIVFNKSIDQLAESRSFKDCKILNGFNSDEWGFFITDYLEKIQLFDYNQLQNAINYVLHYYPIYPQQISDITIDSIIKQYLVPNLNQTSINYIRYLIQIVSDKFFVCPTFQIAEIYAKSGLDAYVYEYKFRISSSTYPTSFGAAMHNDELPMVFGEPLSNKVIYNFRLSLLE